MNERRLRQLRLARGLSLDDLVAGVGGCVSKQAISKYERGLANPSPRVLTVLAKALGVKSAHLFAEPTTSVDFIAYRKGSGLRQKEQARVRSLITEMLEDMIKLQGLTGDKVDVKVPVQSERIEEVIDAENAAVEIRRQWNLGVDPIANLTAVLEDNNVFVIGIDASDKFDGVSAVARTEDGEVRAAAVASRRGISGERQRLNLAHELGHLALNIPDAVDEEKAAFRFGAAFLAPTETVYTQFGQKRSNVSLGELMLFRQKFGISLQAIVYRLKVLGVINDSASAKWFAFINAKGWKKQEPDESAPERPQWLRRNVLRALAEQVIAVEEAERLLGEKLSDQVDTSLIRQRSFMKLTVAKREQILRKQAKEAAGDYRYDKDWVEMPI